MDSYDDFAWASPAELKQLTLGEAPWRDYLRTAVYFETGDSSGTLWPIDDREDGGYDPPLGALHVIAAVQLGSEPDSDENDARMRVLDRELSAAGIKSVVAVGFSFDGNHREDSRAVFGLRDPAARALGLRFGQVAVFAWSGPRWSLLACASDRKEHLAWRWERI